MKNSDNDLVRLSNFDADVGKTSAREMDYDSLVADLLDFDTSHSGVTNKLYNKLHFSTYDDIYCEELIDMDLGTVKKVQTTINAEILTIFFRELLINIHKFSIEGSTEKAIIIVKAIREQGFIDCANHILAAYTTNSNFADLLHNHNFRNRNSSTEEFVKYMYRYVKDMKLDYRGITMQIIEDACEDFDTPPSNPNFIPVNITYYNMRMAFVELHGALFNMYRFVYHNKQLPYFCNEIAGVLDDFGLIQCDDIIVSKKYCEDLTNKNLLKDAWRADVTLYNLSTLIDLVIIKNEFSVMYGDVLFQYDPDYALDCCYDDDDVRYDPIGCIKAIKDAIDMAMYLDRTDLPYSDSHFTPIGDQSGEIRYGI